MTKESDVGDIAKRHAEASTHRGKALLERTMCEAMRVETKELSVVLEGTSIYEIQRRSTLLRSGSEFIWKLVDEENVALASAYLLLRMAKKAAGKGSVDDQLKSMFEEAKRKGSLSMREGAYVLNKKKARSEGDWREVRATIESLVSRELSELDPMERDSMIMELRVELDMLIRQYRIRMKAKQKSGLKPGASDATLRRFMFRDLREIGVDPPRPGRMPDMEEVRRTYRRVAADCHPDRHPGNEHMLQKFRRVNDAYQSVLAYVSLSKPQE